MYYQHKYKCLHCGLHFIVCSDYVDWPNTGTTMEQLIGEAEGNVYCPECGQIETKIHWKEEIDGFIFQAVPGKAPSESIEIGRSNA